ncbi:PST family polysaccharide transporter [Cryobacterium sp. CG_9.6]|nr:PST family polysaccharide transporter [Cryobacterium sp. CG_9.6]
MVTGQVIKLGLLLVNLVVLGRLLSPSDFGLLAMVMAIVGVGELFRDFGLSSAAVQAKSVSHAQKSNLFWINSLLGLFLAGASCAAANLIASLYGDPRLVNVILAISMTFILNGVQTQFQVELIRNHRFLAVAATDVASQVAGLAVAVILALLGGGYWALVGLQLGIAATLCILRVASARWIPSLPSRRTEIKSFLQYGWNLGWAQIVGYISYNIDSIILGARSGASALGLYSRAFQIITLPVVQLLAPLSNVVLPLLSRVESKDVFVRAIIRIQLILSYSAALFFGLLVATAYPFVRLLLGAAWVQSAPILQLLSIGALFQVVTFAGYWVFLARALTKSLLRYNLVTKTFVILCVAVGSSWGPLGVAAGYSLGLVVSWPVSLFWLSRISDFPVRQTTPIVLRGIGLAVTVASCGLAFGALMPVNHTVLQFAINFIGAILGLGLTLAYRPLRMELLQLAAAAAQTVRRKL